MWGRPTVRSSLFFLAAAALAGNIEYALILPSAWLYLQRLGARDPVWLGAAIAAVPAAALASAPLYSRYLDRYPLAWAMLAALVVQLYGSIWYGLAPSPAHVLAARLLCGLGNNIVITYTYVGIAVADERRSVWAAVIGGVAKLGMLVGPALQALLVHVDVRVPRLGLEIDELNAPGFFMALVNLALMLAMPFVFLEPRRRAAIVDRAEVAAAVPALAHVSINVNEAPPAIEAPPKLPRVLSKGLVSLAVSKFVSQFYQMVFETILTPLTKSLFHFTPLKNSVLYAGVAVVAVLALLTVGFAAKRHVHDRSLIYVGQALEGVGISLFTFFWWSGEKPPHPYLALILPSVFLVLGFPLFWTPVSSLAMKLSPLSRQGAAQSTLTAVNAVASISAPLVAGLFLDADSTHLRPLCFLLCALWIFNTFVFSYTHRSLLPADPIDARITPDDNDNNSERAPLLR